MNLSLHNSKVLSDNDTPIGTEARHIMLTWVLIASSLMNRPLGVTLSDIFDGNGDSDERSRYKSRSSIVS